MDEVEELIAKLKDADPKIRGDAARRLGVLRSFIAVPALVEALRDKNFNVRLNAAIAVEKYNGPSATLYQMQKGKNGEERYKPINTLGIIKDPRAIPALIEALKDMDLRERAAKWLGQIGDPMSIPELIEALKDKSSYVRGRVGSSIKLILDKCKTPEQLIEFENKLDAGYARLRKGSKSSEVAFEIMKQISKLKNEIAKKRNSLSEDRGILLADIPKPPKLGKGIYRAMRVIHNG